ncbi:hypothetical protein EVG20_g5394 [Dentipellis fragilis]|uniref:Uncharacterized protein n=1 Tax=Dentipellis fragilis TaxID=205917 RepID=A0A4Y9YTI3_9AGAM|nr:hypothetical protein EVG20_g5394 [Dentipellis fragilis]
MSLSTTFTDLEADIVSPCSKHEQDGGNQPGYSRAFPFRGYFIKFGPHSTFNSEVTTMKYLENIVAGDPSAPRVPLVLHYFYKQGRMRYVVMNFIQLVKVSPESLAEKAAQAVRWMRNVRATEDVVLGPCGGGRARHKVFKDSEAPRNYGSVAALENYFNKAVRLVRRTQSEEVRDISITNERWYLPSLTWIAATLASIPRDGREKALAYDSSTEPQLRRGWQRGSWGTSPLIHSNFAMLKAIPAKRSSVLVRPSLMVLDAGWREMVPARSRDSEDTERAASMPAP